MKISLEYPPIYEEAKKKFELSGREVFTFGDIIYNPSKSDIPDHLMVHEEIHCRQQGNTPNLWWSRYLQDNNFILDQETAAYRAQYKFICEKVKDRNTRYRALHQIATDLSGKMYGNLVSFTEAIRRIRDQS